MRAEVEDTTVREYLPLPQIASVLEFPIFHIHRLVLCRHIPNVPQRMAHGRLYRPLAICRRMAIKTRKTGGHVKNDRHVCMISIHKQEGVDHIRHTSAHDRGTRSYDELHIRDADYACATSRPDGAGDWST